METENEVLLHPALACSAATSTAPCLCTQRAELHRVLREGSETKELTKHALRNNRNIVKDPNYRKVKGSLKGLEVSSTSLCCLPPQSCVCTPRS